MILKAEAAVSRSTGSIWVSWGATFEGLGTVVLVEGEDCEDREGVGSRMKLLLLEGMEIGVEGDGGGRTAMDGGTLLLGEGVVSGTGTFASGLAVCEDPDAP